MPAPSAGRVAMVATDDLIAPNIRVKTEYISEDIWGEVWAFYYKTNVVTTDKHQDQIMEIDVAPKIKPGAWVEMYGLADRTGSQKVNYEVSKQRLWYATFLLDQLGADETMIFGPQNKYFGEDYQAFLDARNNRNTDGQSNFYERVTMVWIWSNPQATIRVLKESDYLFLRYARSTPQP